MPITARQRIAGDPVLASEWNDMVARLRRLEEHFSRFGALGGGIAPSVAEFKYKSSDGDVLVCRMQIEGVEVDEDVYLAKPYLLRPSIVSRDGYTYTYTDDQTRQSTKTSDASTEDQVMTPSWFLDDIIYGVRCAHYTGVVYNPGTGEIPVEWLAKNSDGRQWAKVSA